MLANHIYEIEPDVKVIGKIFRDETPKSFS